MSLISPRRRAQLKSRYPQLESWYRSCTSTALGRFIGERKMMYKHDLEVKGYRDRFKNHGEYVGKNGSDKWIIEEIFKGKEGGFFVECGAVTGAKKSNTFILEKFYKWSGICIESNPDYFVRLQRTRNCVCLNLCLDGKEGEVDLLCYKTTGGIIDEDTDNDPKTVNAKLGRDEGYYGKIITSKTKTLQQVLKDHGAPRIIDFLVLDTEGAETRIMEAFPFDEYLFLTMVIERPTSDLDNYFIRNRYRVAKKILGSDTFYIHESISFNASS